jgi:hypothetical protein
MRPTTRFHAKERWGQLRDERHHLRTLEPFAHHNRAVGIHANKVKYLFCKVNTEYAQLLFHGTRLLLVHDFSRLLKSFWLMEAVPHRGGSISLI